MVKTIWKFAMNYVDQMVEMPEGADILSLQIQNGLPFIWAVVDTDHRRVPRQFRVYGTGHQLPDPCTHLQHVGTFLVENLGEVWHMFEVTKP